ncbi:MAG: replicative DNA helicase [Chlamydiae bacterium]|nr:replicative DNA helicase [Chlamydiota bacterium]
MSEKGILKAPPHSKESEMMVLGCMLTSSNALSVGADGLDESDFYHTEHQLVFKTLKLAFSQEKPADVHLIAEELKRTGKLDLVGGVAYLTLLVQYAGTSAYVEEYVEIIRKKSVLRQMIESSKLIEKKALEEPEDVYSALDEAQSYFFKISQKANPSLGVLIKELISGMKAESKTPYLKELQHRQEAFHTRDPNAPSVTGLPTGFTDLDKMINGFNKANLVILAARPSMGKTALAVNIAEYLVFDKGLAVGIFSLEMTADELLHRMICSLSEVESDRIKTGSLDGMEYQRVVETVGRMQKETLIIDDQPGLKITDLRARARRLKEVYDIQFLVIDYLQLLSGSKGHFSVDNRQNEISEISRMLKNLARELMIPILCLSQLSRKVEDRAGHRPMLSDLRESGSIEQDADIVMFVFRREYYNANDKPGLAEVIVAKNRHGSVGDVELAFRKKFAKFNNFIRESSSSPENEDAFSAFTPGR